MSLFWMIQDLFIGGLFNVSAVVVDFYKGLWSTGPMSDFLLFSINYNNFHAVVFFFVFFCHLSLLLAQLPYKAKRLQLPCYLPIAFRCSFMPFPRVLTEREHKLPQQRLEPTLSVPFSISVTTTSCTSTYSIIPTQRFVIY